MRNVMVRSLPYGNRAAAWIEARRVRLSVAHAILCSLVGVAGGVAHAQGVTYPGGVPYDTLATSFTSSLNPILVGVLPIMVGMMAIWIAPRLFRGLIRSFLTH